MSVEERLERLESQCHRYRVFVVGILLLLAAPLSCTPSATGPSAGFAQDAHAAGALRGTSLEIVNKRGEAVAIIAGNESGGALSLLRPGLNLGVSLQALPMLMLTGPDSTMTIHNASLTLAPVNPAKAKARQQWAKEKLDRHADTSVESNKDRTSFADLMDSPAVEIGVSDERGGIVNVYNPFGKVVASVQSSKTNAGMMYVGDVAGNQVKVLSK